MSKRVLLVVLWWVAAAVWASSRAAGAEVSEPSRAEPCYVVIAVDVSGSMERADEPRTDARGRRWTLRDEGQLVLLQLLPYVYSDLYVGVCHFSDRVRYALPSEETGSVLPWGGNYLNEAACRNLVRPAEFLSSFRTDIPDGLEWALARIQAARRQYGDGPGKVLLLSHGDPRNSSRELSGGGPLLSAGARLAEQDVRIYPIIINEASYRPDIEAGSLSGSERTAESVMVSLATVTGGRAYRIAPEMGFPDVLMDVFGLGRPLADDVRVSPYDWAMVVVGAAPEAVSVTPVSEGADAQPVSWDVDEATASEVRARTVASPQWPATILRRPERREAVDRLWQGRWELRSRDGLFDTAVRVYRIPDFLLELEAAPAFPWWIHQEGQLTARLLDRHRDRRDNGAGAGLSVRLTAQAQNDDASFAVRAGQWTVPAQLYTTEVFTVEQADSYEMACDLLYALGDVNVPLVGLTESVQVQPACVGIDILDASGQVLSAMSDASEAFSLDIEGGQPVYFKPVARGTFNAEPASGTLHLEPLSPATWRFRENTEGDLTIGPIELPAGEERLTGWAALEAQTSLGVRQFRLPDFELVYRPAPLRIDCTFGDVGRALWVGELHRQLVTVSAFPVFERFLDRTRALFPETLPNARMRTVDMQSGTAQVTGPRGRLVETPQPTGAKGRTVVATYTLESDIPIPSSDQAEINVEAAMDNLGGAIKTYEVVDPVAEGLFSWSVYQTPRSQPSDPISRVLYSGEPVRFSARWRADQNISGVRFEIPLTDSEAPFIVDLPVAAGAEQAVVQRPLPALDSDQTYPVYVHVTRRPAPDAPAVEIKLRAGQFRADDRRLVLEEMLVGTEAARDIACYAWEQVEIPLRIVFSGYLADNARHSTIIEQFKTGCTVTVTSGRGDVRDITDRIEWTSLVAASAPAGQAVRCTLEGRAPYMPEHVGRAAIAFEAIGPIGQTASSQRAYGHLAVRDPRLSMSVQRPTPGGELPVFDSRSWAQGAGAPNPVTVGFSTSLGVRIQATEAADVSPSGTWNIVLSVLRRATANGQWIIDSSEDLTLNGREPLVRKVQVSKDGQYALEVVGRDTTSGQALMHLTTPVLITIQQHQVVPVVTPPAWITPNVRRWPFEYRVTLRREPGELADTPLVFQIQLPGDDARWLDAIAHVTESETSQSREVIVTSPDPLPVLGTLRDGAVQFRLSVQESEWLNWEYPSVRALAPVLEKLTFGRLPRGGDIGATDDAITWNGSAGLWARPVFRTANELVGQWVREKTVVYLWPDGTDALSKGQVPPAVLRQIERHDEGDIAISGGQAFALAGDVAEQAVEVLPRRVRWRFWGWPQPAESRHYALVATAIYRPADASEADASRTVSELTPVYSVNLVLPRVIPWCWWFLGALVAYLFVVAILRLFARRPDRLGLDMRLQEHAATVDPAGLDSPIAISLRPTTIGKEIELRTRYLTGKWGGKLLGPLASGVAVVRVLLRRCLLPRRWAWVLITPKIGGNAQGVGHGLVCVWTVPFARQGRAWSSEGGSFELPGDGQVKLITLDLPYRMDGVLRKMRVGVKVTKMARSGMNHGVGGPQAAVDSELMI